MIVKISTVAGAVVLALGLTSPVTGRAETGWRAVNFPPPNGGVVVYRITASGDPACASYNGRSCLWGMSARQIQFNRVRPLVCGTNHQAAWGVTGYENPKHWCNLAKRVVSHD